MLSLNRFLAAALLGCLLVATTSHAQSLPELQQRALAADPGVRAAEAQQRAADERLFQARAAFGPTANLTVNHTDTRYTESPAREVRPFRADQTTLQVTQPIWRGANVSALQAAQAQAEQATAALAQARAESLQRFVEACFEVFKARDVLRHTQALGESTTEQLALARRTFQVGRAAITDVREAEARLDAAQAQALAAEAELDLRQQVLAELTGGPDPTITLLLGRGLAAESLPAVAAPSVLEWIAAAQADSPQLRQAQLALLAAEAEVRKAAMAHAPSADVTFSYSKNNDTGTVTSIFPRRGESTAVAFNLTIPIFASGATQSKVREALALRDKAESDVALARRTLGLGVRQAFVSTLSASAQAKALGAAERSQAVSLRANKRGYEIGLKVGAEVLDAQGKLFEARRDLSRARYDAWAAYFKLKALSGGLNSGDIDVLEAQMVDVVPAEMGHARRAAP